MSLLVAVKEAEFSYLKEKTGATSGNLSVQITKLADAEYIEVKKSFRDNYPLTTCSITKKGVKAFEKYVEDINTYLPTK
jgi:DNA-binding MarR family transcriptional regulator